MEALNLFRTEHAALLAEAYQMDQQLTSLESHGPIKGSRILKELGQSIQNMERDLRKHTNKEENIFFPVLEIRLGSDAGLVRSMKNDHSQLTNSLASLTSELDRMTEDHDTRKTWNLVSKFQQFKGELIDHLSREERVLFWLAELRLSRMDQRKISANLRFLPSQQLA